MRNLTNEWEILDFTEAEAKVLHALLEKGTQSVSRLARVARLPRSTANSALKRLNERRLVKRVSKGYASKWRLVKPEKIAREFEGVVESLGVMDTKEEIEREFGVKVSGLTEFFVFRGAQNMLKVYLNIFSRTDLDRVYAIETAGAVPEITKALSGEDLNKINRCIGDSKIIVEAVLPENIREAYKDIVNKDKLSMETFANRSQAIRLVPSDWFEGNLEFIIFGDSVSIANWGERFLILVRNKDVVSFLKSLYKFAYDSGKPFDQSGYVRGLIGIDK